MRNHRLRVQGREGGNGLDWLVISLCLDEVLPVGEFDDKFVLVKESFLNLRKTLLAVQVKHFVEGFEFLQELCLMFMSVDSVVVVEAGLFFRPFYCSGHDGEIVEHLRDAFVDALGILGNKPLDGALNDVLRYGVFQPSQRLLFVEEHGVDGHGRVDYDFLDILG